MRRFCGRIIDYLGGLEAVAPYIPFEIPYLREKLKRDMMVAAYQLAEEAKRKEAEEAARRRAEERLQKVLDAQKKETEKVAVAEQHTPPEKPKPEPQPEPQKVSDDSKIVINMTPDLLTAMIKTAVTESVNAVWQKFIDNRDTFMNTYGFPTEHIGHRSVCAQD